MNFPNVDAVLGRQRCRQWVPLITQQLRLRHLYQVTAYNIVSDKAGSFYYTLHLTTLCAPFYTSEKINSPNPKWAELEFTQNVPLSVSGVVVRIWQHDEKQQKDNIVLTWGVNFSGLVHIGSKMSEILPSYFKDNSVIFQLRGGFFASHKTLRTDLPKPLPFIDYLNLVSTDENTKICKHTSCKVPTSDVRKSYNVAKLQRIHQLQLALKNKALDAKAVREKIEQKCGLGNSEAELQVSSSVPANSSEEKPVRYATQLLTMNSLNKMLQGSSTPEQKRKIMAISKLIEVARWRTRILTKEKAQKTQHIRALKQKYTQLYEENEERDSELMDKYRNLRKDVEKLRDWRKEQLQQREDLLHLSAQLHHRRRQLILQMLQIYPIRQIDPIKYHINGVYLPDSDLLADCSDTGLSVALGYVAHVLTMCASFLQVPLRYPVVHLGSRSYIIDHISSTLVNDKDREFPLYTKGKDRMQFNYAVYLLNKNIAQLRILCGQHTPDLRATLPNLLTFLQGKDIKDIGPALAGKLEMLEAKLRKEEMTNDETMSTNGDCKKADHEDEVTDPLLDPFKHQCSLENVYTPVKRMEKKIKSNDELGHGLSDILAIPEAYLNKQISTKVFKSYMSAASSSRKSSTSTDNTEVQKSISSKSSSKSNKSQKGLKPNEIAIKISAATSSSAITGEVIEQGTDPLNPNEADGEKIKVYTEDVLHPNTNSLNRRRKSRSVGSYDNSPKELKAVNNINSDPMINKVEPVSEAASLPHSLEERQCEFLQKWLDSGPALVCSEENLYPEEILGFTQENNQSPLTIRTDALLNTTSFNLVKPKY